MKKFSLAHLILMGLIMLASIVAFAGSVYDRTTQTLSTTAGTATLTNNVKYAALNLKRIWIERNLSASATVTVSRVTSDLTYTQSVGSVVCTTGSGSTASFTAGYLAPGDMLTFLNSGTTGAVAIVEYEVQKH
jgi:hypothetical protein